MVNLAARISQELGQSRFNARQALVNIPPVQTILRHLVELFLAQDGNQRVLYLRRHRETAAHQDGSLAFAHPAPDLAALLRHQMLDIFLGCRVAREYQVGFRQGAIGLPRLFASIEGGDRLDNSVMVRRALEHRSRDRSLVGGARSGYSPSGG